MITRCAAVHDYKIWDNHPLNALEPFKVALQHMLYRFANDRCKLLHFHPQQERARERSMSIGQNPFSPDDWARGYLRGGWTAKRGLLIWSAQRSTSVWSHRDSNPPSASPIILCSPA